MKFATLFVFGFAVLLAAPVAATCKIWEVQNTSALTQDRERLFAWSDLITMEALVAEAAGIAQRRANAFNLDFVDVFLTRPEDGTDSDWHMANTTTVWMKYNPGKTPIMDTIWEADALVAGAKAEMADFGMFLGERVDLYSAEIGAILEREPDGVSARCES